MARPRTDIEPRLLNAARAAFLSSGVDGASLRDIAAAASTSVGMVHYYFESKDALFLAVVEQDYEALLARIEAALTPDVPVPERFDRLFAVFAELTEAQLGTVSLIVREALLSTPRMDRLMERFLRGHVPLLLRALSDGMAEGSVRKDLHPLLLMALTFGIGAMPQLMLKVVAPRSPFAATLDSSGLPAELGRVWRQALGASPPSAPPPAEPQKKGAKLPP